MASKPGFFDYITAAFNARPFGMFVAPNWIALGAFGLLGTLEPGFWVLGAGLELGYLFLLATNERFQRLVNARPMNASMAEWNQRIQALLAKLDANDRRVYELLAQRCRSIIDLQVQSASAGAPGGLESQADGLGRLSWMFLRLLVARRTIQHVIGNPADGGELKKRLAALERQRSSSELTEELRRSVTGQIDILNQRLQQRSDAERKLTFLDAELERIQQQVELIRE
ncbi:MAG TPA: hypothetical protein VFJ02_12965, partial [Vicinamibacterales bacterium]|nr:hypothetical protein [Vicinamibacterales bacterium]